MLPYKFAWVNDGVQVNVHHVSGSGPALYTGVVRGEPWFEGGG